MAKHWVMMRPLESESRTLAPNEREALELPAEKCEASSEMRGWTEPEKKKESPSNGHRKRNLAAASAFVVHETAGALQNTG
jgi:hypothetical protein